MRKWQHLDSHTQRWITGILLALPILFILLLGPYWGWYLLVAAAAATGLWEFQGLLFPLGLSGPWQLFFISAGLLFPTATAVAGITGLHAALCGAFLAGFAGVLLFCPQDTQGIPRLAQFILGWLYIPYLLSYVLLIGRMQAAREWIFFMLLVTIASDAGAYYCGSHWGRHKLYPAVSPNKTIEGSLGGILGSMLTGSLYGLLFLPQIAEIRLLLLSAVLALAGQTGDLLESLIKRMYGAKDSSRLLPGHGGLLDRLDSLLLVFPIGWFFLQ